MSKTINGIVAGRIVDGKKLCCICLKILPIKMFYKNSVVKCGYGSNCRDCKAWRSRAENRMLKMEMIIEYGGKCACCGEKGIEFLTIEHINGDGWLHRYNINGNGIRVWQDLKIKGWPKDNYTILCWNCNCAKKYGKFCMHDKEKHEKYNKKLELYLSKYNRSRYFKLKGKL